MSSWYNNKESAGGICVTSRIRLARNIEGLPFPQKMSEVDFAALNSKVKKAILESNTPFAKCFSYIEMNAVPEIEVLAMVERHIISPEFANNRMNKAVLISSDESICIMLGEEDHIRIQVLLEGEGLDKAYNTAEELDNLLCAALPIATHPQLGFLTECPTNLGTGLRASLMLHLPMLEAAGELSRLGEALRKIGFTIRGMYGEGSKASASLYQLSNQITLGISEKDAVNNLNNIAQQIIEKEQSARIRADKLLLEDSVYRAFGTLKNARLLTSKEMLECVSLIKIGTDMGILNIEKYLPIRILIETKAAMLMHSHGKMSAEERDVKRAETVRGLL